MYCPVLWLYLHSGNFNMLDGTFRHCIQALAHRKISRRMEDFVKVCRKLARRC